MVRISRLTDYATIVMAQLAKSDGRVLSTQVLARKVQLEPPTVAKLLKQLAGAGLVDSFRGAQGGYRLAHPPQDISVAQIVTALEGPISMTECCSLSSSCDREANCSVSLNWQGINRSIEQVLDSVSLADMLQPAQAISAHIPLRVTARSDQAP